MGIGNDDVARALERVAGLLEIRGENVFKVRAYRTAVAQIENLGEPVADIAARGELREVPGFGEAIAKKIGEMASTGRLRYLEDLEAEVPPSLLEVRALPQVGPKTAALLWHEAGVTTLDQLEQAALSGRLAGLPRMGQRTVDNILAALAERRTRSGGERRPREQVEPVAGVLVDALGAMPETERVEIAGSMRRGLPSIGDLDIVVATRQPAAVLLAFAALPQVERVLLRGDTKCSACVEAALQVDCRAVAPEEFGAAWQYFTGSQEHNVRLRSLALRQGLTLNEYGVYRVEGGGRVAGATEEDVYACLGLAWIPPDRRQGLGEIEQFRTAAAPTETEARAPGAARAGDHGSPPAQVQARAGAQEA